MSSRTYETSCRTCIWGCKMPVEIIVDNWYKAGASRKVPGRNGMSYEESDWVGEQVTGHRSLEE